MSSFLSFFANIGQCLSCNWDQAFLDDGSFDITRTLTGKKKGLVRRKQVICFVTLIFFFFFFYIVYVHVCKNGLRELQSFYRRA